MSLREWNRERGARARRARDEWARRYEITSVRGLVWTRPMLRVRVMRLVPSRVATYVDFVLDDDTFMRARRGETPASVARAVADRALDLYFRAHPDG